MKQEDMDNLVYRYSMACLEDLRERLEEITKELECLYLDMQDLGEECPSDNEEAKYRRAMSLS